MGTLETIPGGISKELSEEKFGKTHRETIGRIHRKVQSEIFRKAPVDIF